MHGWKKPEWVKALRIDAALANGHAKISKSRINVDKKRTLKKASIKADLIWALVELMDKENKEKVK